MVVENVKPALLTVDPLWAFLVGIGLIVFRITGGRLTIPRFTRRHGTDTFPKVIQRGPAPTRQPACPGPLGRLLTGGLRSAY
jgi:hypothetical protein